MLIVIRYVNSYATRRTCLRKVQVLCLSDHMPNHFSFCVRRRRRKKWSTRETIGFRMNPGPGVLGERSVMLTGEFTISILGRDALHATAFEHSRVVHCYTTTAIDVVTSVGDPERNGKIKQANNTETGHKRAVGRARLLML